MRRGSRQHPHRVFSKSMTVSGEGLWTRAKHAVPRALRLFFLIPPHLQHKNLLQNLELFPGDLCYDRMYGSQVLSMEHQNDKMRWKW